MSVFPFENTYVNLPHRFYAEVTPSTPSNPGLIGYNESLAKELGLHLETLSERELAEVFSGTSVPQGAQPIALAYAGHQFGHFVPQLGDGRAVLLGEVVGRDGNRYDIQLKGSGVTPFSRQGDGKSSLGPVLREYIVSEAMFHLGVPTTRALAATTTGETVYRQEPLPGGVFTRVASSHIRVGSFEYFAARSDRDGVEKLLKYSAERHYPEILEEKLEDKELPLAFFRKVVEAQAALVAHWMDIGFIHGVMNTDNTSVGGITIDYGPCAFMDEFKNGKVFSSIDRQGRYAYANQPAIAQWNLERLAETLLLLVEGEKAGEIAAYEKELGRFEKLYKTHWLQRMSRKLGILEEESQDAELIHSWLQYLEKEELDYTLSFRQLAELCEGSDKNHIFQKTPEFELFFQKWQARLQRQEVDLKKVIAEMNRRNPLYIPRNHQIEHAIQIAIAGDFSIFREMCEVLKRPFDEQKIYEAYQVPPRSNERVLETFCGT